MNEINDHWVINGSDLNDRASEYVSVRICMCVSKSVSDCGTLRFSPEIILSTPLFFMINELVKSVSQSVSRSIYWLANRFDVAMTTGSKNCMQAYSPFEAM